MFLFKEGWSHHAFQITFFVTSYLLPLLLICGLYLCMLMRLWRGVAPGGRVSAESRRGKKRVTRMVIIVVVIFAVCWCPIQILLVLKSVELFEPNTSLGVIIQITSHVLAYMNSCVNPVLYAFLSDNFRKAFRKVGMKLVFLFQGDYNDSWFHRWCTAVRLVLTFRTEMRDSRTTTAKNAIFVSLYLPTPPIRQTST